MVVHLEMMLVVKMPVRSWSAVQPRAISLAQALHPHGGVVVVEQAGLARRVSIRAS